VGQEFTHILEVAVAALLVHSGNGGNGGSVSGSGCTGSPQLVV